MAFRQTVYLFWLIDIKGRLKAKWHRLAIAYHRACRWFWEQTPKDWRRRRFLARLDFGKEKKYERLSEPCPKCGGVQVRIKKYGCSGCIDCPHEGEQVE